jgi:hypothetical protein
MDRDAEVILDGSLNQARAGHIAQLAAGVGSIDLVRPDTRDRHQRIARDRQQADLLGSRINGDDDDGIGEGDLPLLAAIGAGIGSQQDDIDPFFLVPVR